jgi:hypothetical protein
MPGTAPSRAAGTFPFAPCRVPADVAVPRLPPTAEVSVDERTWRRGTWARRAFLGLLALVVIAGLLHVLGVRSRTVIARSRSGRVVLSVEYAQVARAGLAVPFRITVHRAGGFDRPVTVAVSSDYLDLFARNAVDPQPTSETSTGARTEWTYDTPPAATFVVTVDLQVQQGKHFGRRGQVMLLDPDRHVVARATFTTWLAP